MGDMADWTIDNDPWINGEEDMYEEDRCISIYPDYMIYREWLRKLKINYKKGDFLK